MKMKKPLLLLIIILIIVVFSLAGCKEEAKTKELEAKIAKLEEEIEAAKEEITEETEEVAGESKEVTGEDREEEEATASSTSDQAKNITLADAPLVLDMSSELPTSFERLDATAEGMSNKDLGLGPDFSEVELFLSEDPYQMVFAYFSIIESKMERATTDALLKDEEQIKPIAIEGLRAGAAEEGLELGDVTVNVTYPNIGDLAVLGSGTVSAYGSSLGYDLLMIKSNKVYVFISSLYLPGENVPLPPLAEGIEQRIGAFSQ